MRNLLRVTFSLACVVAATTSIPALADDCIIPNAEVVNGVNLRAEPRSNSAKLGSLLPGQGLPFVASVPNWYETRLANGQPAFAHKRWLDIGACTQASQPTVGAVPTTAGPSFTIDVFDVGTGLSVLARGPDFSLLYDAGSNDDFATGENNRVIAYLKEVAPETTRLSHVILSHPHKDHVELLPDVIESFAPDNIWDSGSRGNMTCGYWEFLKSVVALPATRYHTATQGSGPENVSLKTNECVSAQPRSMTISHDSRIDTSPLPLGNSATIEFLHADGTSYTPSQDPNRNSLVVRLTLGTRRVVIMGDAPGGERQSPSTAPAQNSIEGKLLQCCAQDLFADVLIVGHHGSKTSSRNAFINAVGATIYAISSGPKEYSDVKLPDNVIVQALRARGQVFRTDMNDADCATSQAKVGRDDDGKPGGCDAVRITIPAAGPILAAYERIHD